MCTIYVSESLYAFYEKYCTLENFALLIGIVYLLSFLVIITVQCFFSDTLKLARYKKELVKFVARFRVIDNTNIKYFDYKCSRKLPKKVKNEWKMYEKIKRPYAYSSFLGLVEYKHKKTGTICFYIYLALYVLGIVAITILGNIYGVYSLSQSAFIAGALFLGAVLFVVMAYQMYYVYNKYYDIASSIDKLLSSHVRICGNDIKVINENKSCDNIFIKKANSEKVVLNVNTIDALKNKVEELSKNNDNEELIALIKEGLKSIKKTEYCSGEDNIKIDNIIDNVGDNK